MDGSKGKPIENLPPSQVAHDFADWIGNFALRNNLAVMSIIWDKGEGTAAIMIVEGANDNCTDRLGGFSARVSHALLSQKDIADGILRAA